MTPSEVSPTRVPPVSLVTMASLRNQAVSMTLKLWLAHGVHPVHVKYLSESSGAAPHVEATLKNASDEVAQTGGDAYSLVARGYSEDPQSTHVFCVPHQTENGEILVIAEGGGEFSPGHYRIACHPALHNILAEETKRFLISHLPLDVQEGMLISATLH